MNGMRPEEDEEKLDLTDKILAKNRKIRQYKLAYCMVVIFIYIGYRFFGIIGALVCGGLGVLANMINGAFLACRLEAECERDWTKLVSVGYSSQEAIEIISKSFFKSFSSTFHKKVVDKCPSIDMLIAFYAGALPEGPSSEEWATELLEKTTMERQPSGMYVARTRR
jgi:hypothetical protein